MPNLSSNALIKCGEPMFFKRLFKKPPPPKPAVERLSLEELHERVKKLRAKKLEDAELGLNPLLEEITKDREKILDELKALTDAEPTEEIHPGLLKTATEARKLFIEKMTRGLAEIQRRPEFSVDTLAAFDGKLAKATNLTTHAMVTHARYLRDTFGSKFTAIESHLRGLHGLARQVHVGIESILRDDRSLDSISSEINSHAELIQHAEKVRNDIKSLEGRAKEIEEKVKKGRGRLTQLMSSEEFKRVAESRRKLEQARVEINRVRSEAVSAFSDLSRPLRKLDKLVASGGHQMDREMIKTLELCINNPAETISSDEKISAAEALLQETAKLLAERKIDLDDRKRRKKLEMARKLAVGLREFKKRLELLNQQLETQRRAAEHPIQKQTAELERVIDQHESELKRVKESIEEFGRKSELMKDEIEGKRVKLEGLASETLGSKIELTS